MLSFSWIGLIFLSSTCNAHSDLILWIIQVIFSICFLFIVMFIRVLHHTSEIFKSLIKQSIEKNQFMPIPTWSTMTCLEVKISYDARYQGRSTFSLSTKSQNLLTLSKNKNKEPTSHKHISHWISCSDLYKSWNFQAQAQPIFILIRGPRTYILRSTPRNFQLNTRCKVQMVIDLLKIIIIKNKIKEWCANT